MDNPIPADVYRELYELNEERFWRLVKFEAEHEPDRMAYYEELDAIERDKRAQRRRERGLNAPPLPTGSLRLEDALAKLEDLRLVGDFKWRSKCPVHGGDSRPLLITEKESRPGEAYFHCFAGCDFRHIKDALQ
jgi:hypothetical protein